jgi:uncharacterized protein (TIGR02284 family)
MSKAEVIIALNELIRTCKDGEQGFKTCIDDASDRHPQLKMTLEQCQRECAAAVTDLRNVIQTLGGTPEITLSIGAALQRGWLDVRTAIIGKNDAAVLNACERGETGAVDHYRKVLEMELPTEVRMVVERQYQEFLRNLDKFRQLREEIQVSA